MRTEKELGAIRVMDALSAVDGELLERSEKAGADAWGENKEANRKGNKKRRYVYRYAMACAACLCLIIAGTAYYGLSHMRLGSADGGAAGNGAAANEFCVPQAAEDSENGEEAGEVSEDLQFSVREPDWLDISRLSVLSESYGTEQEIDGSENSPEEKGLDGLQKEASSYPELSWEPEAGAVVPEGYILERAELGNEEPGGLESSLYKWSDGDHSLWLKITRTELTADMRFETDPPVCTVKQEWAEMLPDAGENGIVRFALLYENGMLAEYCGVLEKDEIVRLLESLVR